MEIDKIIQSSFICYKQAFFRYMIIDILIKHNHVHIEYGFLNRIIEYQNKTYQLFNKSDMSDVRLEVDYLIKIGAIVNNNNLLLLTDLGRELAKSSTFENISTSCLSSYTSLIVSSETFNVNRRTLNVSKLALCVSFAALFITIITMLKQIL